MDVSWLDHGRAMGTTDRPTQERRIRWPYWLGGVVLLLGISVAYGLAELGRSESSQQDWQLQTLQLSLVPPQPRVGSAVLKIDVRCGCVIESYNGPAYDFQISGDGFRVVDPPVYHPGDDVYYATLEFDAPGTRTISVRIRGDVWRDRSISVDVAASAASSVER